MFVFSFREAILVTRPHRTDRRGSPRSVTCWDSHLAGAGSWRCSSSDRAPVAVFCDVRRGKTCGHSESTYSSSRVIYSCAPPSAAGLSCDKSFFCSTLTPDLRILSHEMSSSWRAAAVSVPCCAVLCYAMLTFAFGFLCAERTSYLNSSSRDRFIQQSRLRYRLHCAAGLCTREKKPDIQLWEQQI